MRPIHRRTFITVVLAGSFLTACTQTDDSAPERNDSDSSPDPDKAVATASFYRGGTEVTIEFRPIVRTGEHLVLTMDLSAKGTPEDMERDLDGGLNSAAGFHWADGWGNDPREFLGIRLVDLAGDTVASTAMDSAGTTVCLSISDDEASGGTPEDGSKNEVTGVVQIAFGDPGASALSVYAQEIPLMEAVPVIDGEIPTIEGAGGEIDLDSIDEAPVSPMLSVSQDLAEPIREKRGGKTSTVEIGSDVLFESSSATLNKAADTALDTVADRIRNREPGKVNVIGHTDDVDSNSFNLTLSKKRAEAVAKALENRVGSDGYEFSTDGHGESEPIADNGSEDGKALNRRVEVSMETALKDAVTKATKTPEFEGKTATANEGIEFTKDDDAIRPFTLEFEQARMVEGHLVVTLTATAQDNEVDGVYGIGQFDFSLDIPQEPDGVSDFTLIGSDAGAAVIVGTLVTFPVFYQAGGPEKTTRPLTGLSLNTAADGGVPRTLELVYPRDIAGVGAGKTVTLQYTDSREGWRMIDVPIES